MSFSFFCMHCERRQLLHEMFTDQHVCSHCGGTSINDRGVVRAIGNAKYNVIGLGDMVAGIARLMGITKTKGCGCERRQAKLNDAVTLIRKRT